MIIERMIQEIFPDKWGDLEQIDKKYNAAEARLGFPPKKRFQYLMGVHPFGTLIIEREWPSMAALEEANMKSLMDPEYQSLREKSGKIIRKVHWEVLMPMP